MIIQLAPTVIFNNCKSLEIISNNEEGTFKISILLLKNFSI